MRRSSCPWRGTDGCSGRLSVPPGSVCLAVRVAVASGAASRTGPGVARGSTGPTLVARWNCCGFRSGRSGGCAAHCGRLRRPELPELAVWLPAGLIAMTAKMTAKKNGAYKGTIGGIGELPERGFANVRTAVGSDLRDTAAERRTPGNRIHIAPSATLDRTGVFCFEVPHQPLKCRLVGVVVLPV
jgi:hypothetical protein